MLNILLFSNHQMEARRQTEGLSIVSFDDQGWKIKKGGKLDIFDIFTNFLLNFTP